MQTEPEQVTQAEADQFLQWLRSQQEEYRRRLADPEVRAQIDRGQLAVNPLVSSLLDLDLSPATAEE